jgi:phage-related protein
LVLASWRSSSPTTETPIERVYTVRFEKAVYVLHAFQKKSPSGIRTAKGDVDLVAERLKTAERDYEEHHGKQKR